MDRREKKVNMVKNVYMVQASATYGGNLFKAAYLPYAAGLLVANAWEDETIRQAYAFKRFVFTREVTDEAVASFEEPAVIGFSNYIWNTRYNLALARKTKEKYPDCVIIFGGHNVPPDESFLKEYPYIDFLIHAEGEDAFRALLLELLAEQPDFGKINNLSFRCGDGYVTTPQVIQTRTDYPSPYLTGIFDSIVEEHPDMQLDAILETSRGCPRHCAYCDWGCTDSAVKLFPMERVLAEIDWFAAHKVAFLWGADANFGAYERDEEIARHLLEVREKYGYPERLRTNYAKNHRDRVFRINRMLEKDGITKEGATLSFQSLNPDTLKAIGRQNMSLEQFKEQIAMYRSAGVTTYSELILGLPLETYESFCRGLGLLLENGQHRLINVYNCELLPNSPMAQPEYMKKYGIKTADVIFLTAHSKLDSEIVERSNYVVATSTMSEEQWVNANVFACFEKSMHHNGMLRSLAIYSFYEKHIRYEDFYNSVIDFAKRSDKHVVNNGYAFLYNFYNTVVREEPMKLYTNDIYGKISWAPDFTPYMDVIYRLDEYYEAMRPLFLSLGIEDGILTELYNYQKCILKRAFANHFSHAFTYDWHRYFKTVIEGSYAPLEKRTNRIRVDNEKTIESWQEYGVDGAWFGKDGHMFNLGISVEYTGG